MPLMVYNTLTRKKEPFHKRPPAEVSMYVCGPTVYKPSHIGHMVGPVIFDTVKRFLVYLGYKVKWIVNITDVDDKLIARAAEIEDHRRELAGRMTVDYLEYLKRLNVTGIDQMPSRNRTHPRYDRDDGEADREGLCLCSWGRRLFRRHPRRGLRQTLQPRPGATRGRPRVEMTDRKRNPGDFALWKGVEAGRAAEALGESLGVGQARLAHRMLGDEHEVVRRYARHPRRRA